MIRELRTALLNFSGPEVIVIGETTWYDLQADCARDSFTLEIGWHEISRKPFLFMGTPVVPGNAAMLPTACEIHCRDQVGTPSIIVVRS